MLSSCPQIFAGRAFAARDPRRGITVIELLITLAVVGLLMVVGYMGVRHVRQSDLREDTVRVASSLRASYNMATMSGNLHRLVIDLDKQTYRIEACKGEIKLRRTQQEVQPEDEAELAKLEIAQSSSIPKEMLSATSPEQATKVAAALSGTRIGTAACKPPVLPNGDADGRGDARKLSISRAIRFKRVFVQHLEEPATKGIVKINFFPLGYAEKAVIEVADDDDHVYALLVHGMTGRVEFRTGELRDPDEHMMRNGIGDRVEDDR